MELQKNTKCGAKNLNQSSARSYLFNHKNHLKSAFRFLLRNIRITSIIISKTNMPFIIFAV